MSCRPQRKHSIFLICRLVSWGEVVKNLFFLSHSSRVLHHECETVLICESSFDGLIEASPKFGSLKETVSMIYITCHFYGGEKTERKIIKSNWFLSRNFLKYSNIIYSLKLLYLNNTQLNCLVLVFVF